ncbi:transglycosylase domain-containing protein [Saezia sanguinis]|uniref:transglycosylase domain-containing protein n=1 Tax=Saezia sanguinis TaxID=1965230 RepID=UPI00305065E7
MVKLLIQLVLAIFGLVVLALIALAIYVQFTKPPLPAFEQLKNQFHPNENAALNRWVNIEHIPAELQAIYLAETNDPTFWQREQPGLLEVVISGTCLLSLWPTTRENPAGFYSRVSTKTALLVYRYQHNTVMPIDRKGRWFYECILPVDIERQWTKQQIIEASFNLSFYGARLNGLYAASHILFEKEPQQLTTPESAILVAIMRTPVSWHEESAVRIGCTRLEQASIPNAQQHCAELPALAHAVYQRREAYMARPGTASPATPPSIPGIPASP